MCIRDRYTAYSGGIREAWRAWAGGQVGRCAGTDRATVEVKVSGPSLGAKVLLTERGPRRAPARFRHLPEGRCRPAIWVRGFGRRPCDSLVHHWFRFFYIGS